MIDRSGPEAEREVHGSPGLRMPAVIFTDLDGSLLDHFTYDPGPARSVLGKLEAMGIPVVMTTSKTLEETLVHQQLLHSPAPFIVENGGLACLPLTEHPAGGTDFETANGYRLLVQPPGVDSIVSSLERIGLSLDLELATFHSKDAKWVAQQTGLSLDESERARCRRASMPLLWQHGSEDLERFRVALAEENLTLLKGGRFHHVLGHWDKGDAMERVLQEIAPPHQARPQVIAFGDGPNDVSMLQHADIAVVVRDAAGNHLSLKDHPDCLFTHAKGPEGWAEAANQLIRSLK